MWSLLSLMPSPGSCHSAVWYLVDRSYGKHHNSLLVTTSCKKFGLSLDHSMKFRDASSCYSFGLLLMSVEWTNLAHSFHLLSMSCMIVWILPTLIPDSSNTFGCSANSWQTVQRGHTWHSFSSIMYVERYPLDYLPTSHNYLKNVYVYYSNTLLWCIESFPYAICITENVFVALSVQTVSLWFFSLSWKVWQWNNTQIS